MMREFLVITHGHQEKKSVKNCSRGKTQELNINKDKGLYTISASNPASNSVMAWHTVVQGSTSCTNYQFVPVKGSAEWNWNGPAQSRTSNQKDVKSHN